MRSSIACVHCRRSKIKCVNDGEAKAACETCLKSERDCHYPEAGTSFLSHRGEPELLIVSVSAAGGAGKTLGKRAESGQPAERAAADRKKLKKTDDSSRLDPQTSAAFYANEVLTVSYLSETMWSELFDIYRLNFATELPFLHIPTLKEQVGEKFKASLKRRSESTNLVLLGVLTLTSRFHSNLVKYISYSLAIQNGVRVRAGGYAKPDPAGVSEFCADVLSRALGPLHYGMTTVSVERIQALLMLGLYEWSQSKKKSRGLGAWMYVGMAIRMAQALGLCYEEQPNRRRRPSDTEIQSSSSSASPTTGRFIDNASDDANAEDIVRQEIRRRTMFSCFILDRMLSCGKGRMPAIRSEDLHVQLPCSEFSFDLSETVQTGFLKPAQQVLQAATPAGMGAGNTMATTASETESISVSSTIMRPSHDSVLARFISLIDIWGEISKYSFSGGRLTEKQPPWEDSEFRRLRNALDDFYAGLPGTFRLSSSNYHKHENHQASGAYVSLHMLGAVCQIMLHREYVPFIPVRCRRPMGPLDEPIFPEGSAPEGFWDESAEQMFKAAHDIVMLTEICVAGRKMPMSALTVFAVWTAAFVGIYAWHFPQLDTNKHMVWSGGSGEPATATAEGDGSGADSSGDRDDGSEAAEEAGAAGAAENAGAETANAGGDNAGAAPGETDADQSNKRYTYHAMHNGPTGTAYFMLRAASRSLHMAAVFVKSFRDMNKYYEGVKKDFEEHLKQHGGTIVAKVGVRQGGQGGGLDEWKHGVKITNNGAIGPSDSAGTTDDSDVSRASTREAEESGSGTTASEPAASSDSDLGQATDSRSTRAGPLRATGPRKGPLCQGEVIIVEDDGDDEDSGEAVPPADVVAPRAPDTPIASMAPPPWAASEAAFARPPQHVRTHSHPQATPGPSTPSLPQHQQQNQNQHQPRPQASGFVDMDMDALYATADVEQYVDKNQGKRWQEAVQATGIEQFSYGDPLMAAGEETWALETTSSYGIPAGEFTEMLN